MNKLKIITALFFISLVLNLYFLARLFGPEMGLILWPRVTGIIYREDCPESVIKSRVCSIEVLEKRSDFAMVRIHYHYIKGEEHSNRIVVKANKGSHDNVVGTRSAFDLKEGDNIIDIPFGMYRAGKYSKDRPYMSKFIMVEAQGISEDGKRYISPRIFQVYADYEHPWYTEGEYPSWQ